MARPAGWLGRRLGLRRAMLIGLAALAACFATMLSVETLPKPLWGAWLIGSYMLAGASIVLTWVNAVPFLMGATGTEERSHAFALWQGLQGLGAFAGSLAAGGLVGPLSRWGGSRRSRPRRTAPRCGGWCWPCSLPCCCWRSRAHKGRARWPRARFLAWRRPRHSGCSWDSAWWWCSKLPASARAAL